MITNLNLLDIISIPYNECIQQTWDFSVNQVHMWYIPFDERFIDTTILSSDELLRGDEYRFDIHKKRFVMYRCALRKILSFYYDKQPEELIFGYTKYSKPYVLTNPRKIQFNLSHSSNMAVLGLTKSCHIGVDVEYIKPIDDMQSIVKQFFSEAEFCNFISLPEKDKLEAFYDIWTRKEAFIKAIGEGLSHPLDKFTVSFSANEPPRIIEINNSEVEAMKWSIKSFVMQVDGKNYKIACSVKNKTCNINKFTLVFH